MKQVSHYYKLSLSIFRTFEALTLNFMGRQLITTKFIYCNLLESMLMPPRVPSIFQQLISLMYDHVCSAVLLTPLMGLGVANCPPNLTDANLLSNTTSTETPNVTEVNMQWKQHYTCSDCRMLNGLWRFVKSTLTADSLPSQFHIKHYEIYLFTPHACSSYNVLLDLLINTIKYSWG